MKILFYGAKDYDRLYFDPAIREAGFDCRVKYLQANLDRTTASLASGYEAVCLFVNADCSRPVLEVLARHGVRLLLLRCAGFNHVDLEAARSLGLTVLRVPGYSPEAVAEFAMALALTCVRRLHKAYIKVRNNNFSLDGLLGRNLSGSTAGIIGTGKIGVAMARICRGFGMDVIAYDSYPNPTLDGLVTYCPLEEVLRRSDLISLHCPLTPQTHHMINRETIALMKDTAILINTSRGPLIHTEALLEALRQHKFSAVGLDVYENEECQVFEDCSDEVLENEQVPQLLAFPNVIVTSHQAFFTHTALETIARITIENARAFALGHKLKNQV